VINPAQNTAMCSVVTNTMCLVFKYYAKYSTELSIKIVFEYQIIA